MTGGNMKTNTLFVALASLIALGMSACAKSAKNGDKTYEYTAIKRGAIEKTVSSSGSLTPVATVNVLSFMSGKVEKIYTDYNAIVKKGDVLAELNTDMLKLEYKQELAAVIESRATYEAKLVNYQSQQRFSEKKLISDYELKTSKTELDVQAAKLASAEAKLEVIETKINQYAAITAPIDGIVLERSISVGDTVTDSSSNSSSASIFLLAENLEEMQIETGVGELDISSIRVGQDVRFTVEALPRKTFSGVVSSKRLMPTVSDNVVSYTVIINVDNKDGSLLPGMTCAVEFIEERSEDILLVPNAALRYQPSSMTAEAIADKVFTASLSGMTEEQRNTATTTRDQQQSAPASSGANSGANRTLTSLAMPNAGAMGRMGGGMGPPPQGQSGRQANQSAPTQEILKSLWFINESGKLDVVMVRVGISDGSFTEIHAVRGSSDNALENISKIILKEKVL
jgi:HlyD family secretion protein